MVLWTTWFIWLDALIIPPAPPGMKNNIPINGAKKRTSFQGIFLIQPNTPFAPSSRPRASNVANIENAVIIDGITTIIVKITWINFQNGSMPGSVNWWWNPTGIEKNKSKINVNLANESEKIFPPIIFGIIAYHII